MLDLLTNYSLQEILVFTVTLLLAVKGAVSFFDWAKDRIQKAFDKKRKETDKELAVENRLIEDEGKIKNLIEQQKKTEEIVKKIMSSVKILIDSDKDDIKAWITEKHHYFCYEKRWIDDYSLDCMEKRFSHYEEEGGNSFVASLMRDVRQLPNVSVVQEDKEKKGEKDYGNIK